MAAFTASERDPRMRAFHERLLANGKKPLLAITAVMRKLVVIRNAMPRHNEATARARAPARRQSALTINPKEVS